MTDNDPPWQISRRKYLSTIGAATGIGLAGCLQGGNTSNGGSGGTKSGGGQKTYKFGFSIKNMNNPWLQVFRKTGVIYAQGLGHEITATQAGGSATKQIQNVTTMLQSGIDALLISPYSSKAAVGVIDKAARQDVPVYTTNSTAPTESVTLFTGFGSFNAGYRAGQIMIDALDQYGGSRLIDLVGDPADQSSIKRSKGFKKAIEEASGVKVVETIFCEGWSQQVATKKLSAYVQKTENFDGIYSVWGGGALAAVNVLNRYGLLYKRTNKNKYVPIINIDGFPSVLDNIRKGNIYAALQQPMPFYAPISFEYMIKHLSTGKPHIPKSGDTVKKDELEVKNIKYNGVTPFSTPYWAPGKVIPWKSNGKSYYPWLQPQTLKITQENVDKEYLWGNYASKILK
jgi:D-xylose transport system substrate-binding protein